MADVSASLAQLEELADELAQRGETRLADRARAAVAELRASTTAPELIGTGEAAALLGIRSINTVKRWVREGRLEGFQVGGRVKISRGSVERLRSSAALQRRQAYERDLTDVLDAVDAGDEPAPRSELPHAGRAPWRPGAAGQPRS